MSEERRYGDRVDAFHVGPLRVEVKYSCIRRDMYDITLGAPFPAGIRALFERHASVRGNDVVFVLDVEGVHRITVSVPTGRIAVMPKLATERAAQREAALALAHEVAALIEGGA